MPKEYNVEIKLAVEVSKCRLRKYGNQKKRT